MAHVVDATCTVMQTARKLITAHAPGHKAAAGHLQGKCECYNGYSGGSCSVAGPKPNDCNQVVGTNVEGIADWMRSWAFVDLTRHARAWITQVD
jgi:hypothetical protein